MEKLLEKLTESLTLLVEANCPNSTCDNNGTIAVQVRSGEWEPEPCEWCSRKKALLDTPIISLPTREEIDKNIDNYAFRIPYDNSNNFYDEIALKHYKAGIEWLLSRMGI